MTEADSRESIKAAVGYMRTSSAANVGEDKDSQQRQRAAILAYARSAGFEIADGDWYYDAAVKGSDAVMDRAGFAAMLERIVNNGARTIIVESPDRFARDLVVQLTGHDHLKSLGIALIPASAPDYFIEDTPTAVLVRQVLGAIAQFEKANLVAKLKAARDRKRVATGKCGGRKSHAEARPEVVALVRQHAPNHSLRAMSKWLLEQGYTNGGGKPFSPSAIKSMIEGGDSRESA